MLKNLNYMVSWETGNYCKYLFEDEGKWLCEIREAHDNNDEEFIKLISQIDYEYFLEECLNYPDPDSPAHTPPRHYLLEGCTFKLIRIGNNGISE